MGKEMRNNKELAEFQANLQTQENQRQEAVNADEWTRQFGMQEQQWQQHFQQETEWNSEQAKAQRLREVGVNPIAALGGSPGQTISTANTGTPTVSPRSGVSSSPAPYASSTPQILNSLNDAIATMGKVGLENAERNRINKLLRHEIDKTIAETDNEREQSIMTRFANMMTKEQWPYKVQMAAVDMYDKIQNIFLKQSQEKNFDADSFYKSAQAEFTNFLKSHGEKMEPWQVMLAKQEAEWYVRLKSEEIRTMKSQQELNAANAFESKESTRGLKLLNDINYENKHILVAQLAQEYTNMVNAGVITEEQANQASLTTSILDYAEDHKEVDYWRGVISDIIKNGVDVANAVANSRSAGAWSRLSEAQRRNVDAKIRELEKHDDVMSTQYKWDGKRFVPVSSSRTRPTPENWR